MEIQRYPLVMTNSLLLKMTIEIVDLPIDSMVIFHSFLLTFTRGYRTVLYYVNIMTTSKGVVLAK